jgi:hypothetical protein
MCFVLEPYLGFELARERANNIAQVLAILPEEPSDVAFAMLERTGVPELRQVARAVGLAWRVGVEEMERVERVA